MSVLRSLWNALVMWVVAWRWEKARRAFRRGTS